MRSARLLPGPEMCLVRLHSVLKMCGSNWALSTSRLRSHRGHLREWMDWGRSALLETCAPFVTWPSHLKMAGQLPSAELLHGSWQARRRNRKLTELALSDTVLESPTKTDLARFLPCSAVGCRAASPIVRRVDNGFFHDDTARENRLQVGKLACFPG